MPGARDDEQVAVGDPGSEHLGVGHRGLVVEFADDHERGCADVAEL
jgi:hypothetical protein